MTAGRFLAGGLVWIYALLLLLPLYFLLVSSFKENTAIFNNPFELPASWSFDNYADAWNRAKLGSALRISIIVALISEVLTIVLGVPAAYAITRGSTRISAAIERFFGLGFLIPAFAALVPTLLLSIKLGLFHTWIFLSLFMVATTLSLSIILLAQFMRTIPRELDESATMDGASRLRILWSIYVPLTLPGIAMVLILNFLAYWNEYLFSLVLVGSDERSRTIQVALPSLIDLTRTEYGVLLAGTVIALIPVYVLYLAMSRRVEGALTAGAIKG